MSEEDVLADFKITGDGMRDIIRRQISDIEKCLDLLSRRRLGEITLPQGDPAVFYVIATMIHMIGISGESVLKLTTEADLGAKDAYPITRAIIEGTVNVCYIMAKGRETAEKAMRHAEVKAYRDLKRHWDAGGVSITITSGEVLPPDEIQRLEVLAEEFTTRKGRDIDWTDDNLRQKIDAIGDVFIYQSVDPLNHAAFAIYRSSSEVIHGSYYGALFFWGLKLTNQDEPFSEHDAVQLMHEHRNNVLMAVALSYSSLLACFGDYIGALELERAAMADLERLGSLPMVQALKPLT
ncbi:MAG TPA: DUF5677 domain-containing protein [Allosphingosinicella sp.]|jgi:hypothetical protein